jgi:hypothetical protein
VANGGAAISENAKREKILAWISEDNAYRRKLQERQAGTRIWFLKSKARMVSWRWQNNVVPWDT